MKEIIFQTSHSVSWRELRKLTQKKSDDSPNGGGDEHHHTKCNQVSLTAVLLYGSWSSALKSNKNNNGNHNEELTMQRHRNNISTWISNSVRDINSTSINNISLSSGHHEVLSIKVDQDDETMDICISDFCSLNVNNNNNNSSNNKSKKPMTMMANDEDDDMFMINAPADLPALILMAKTERIKGDLVHVNIDHDLLSQCLVNHEHQSSSSSFDTLFKEIQTSVSLSIKLLQQALAKEEEKITISPCCQSQSILKNRTQIRIFVAGDKSQVGKSSVCLGLIGTLLTKYNYKPSQLAYIKPATQCEESQLIAKYCEKNNIAHEPIGPIVYYKGFTRAFLNGETDDTKTLLERVKQSVDTIALDKDVVIIDGVGYPAVGSICGTDNVSVALACGYTSTTSNLKSSTPPAVLIVGKRGVGDAIDSYNLNATYFRAKNVQVMGAIFNRLPTDPSNFYSLDNCKMAISKYFENKPNNQEEVFGFVPEMEELSSSSLESADKFIELFSSHVDLSRILGRAMILRENGFNHAMNGIDQNNIKHGFKDIMDDDHEGHIHKKIKLSSPNRLSRQEIEKAARAQGAAGG